MNWKRVGLVVALGLAATSAEAVDKVRFGTNWLAEAEHGGYYQAVADGTFAKYGLDVEIVQGGRRRPTASCWFRASSIFTWAPTSSSRLTRSSRMWG